MLADRSQDGRKEITGITTLTEAVEALSMLSGLGVPDDAPIHSYLHVGWTGSPVGSGGEPDPAGRTTSIALWVEVKE